MITPAAAVALVELGELVVREVAAIVAAIRAGAATPEEIERLKGVVVALRAENQGLSDAASAKLRQIYDPGGR